MSLRIAAPCLFLMIVVGCGESNDPVAVDTSAPARIDDLQVTGISPASITLGWTATGDDGQSGRASEYDVRVSGTPFDESNWSTAPRVVFTLAPAPPGSTEELRVPFLQDSRAYYFAIRALDDFFNPSPVSAVISATTHGFAFRDRFGGFGSVAQGIALDDSGNIYVVSTAANQITKLSPSYQHVRTWGSVGAGLGQLSQPRGIAFGNGLIYVADSFNRRVQVFTRNGVALYDFGSDGSGDGQFRRPVGVATDPDGNVYVTDSVRERVQVFDRRGLFRAGWGGPGFANGMFHDVVAVAADAAGNVYVVDQANDHIQVFTRTGTFVRGWGRPGSGNGEFGVATGIGVDADGAVYVTDEARNDFQKFTPEGERLGVWNTRIDAATRPSAIAVGPDGRAYVVYLDVNFATRFGTVLP